MAMQTAHTCLPSYANNVDMYIEAVAFGHQSCIDIVSLLGKELDSNRCFFGDWLISSDCD